MRRRTVRTLKRGTGVIMMSAVAIISAACDGDNDATPASLPSVATSCGYDFEATVRAGPSADLALRGRLVVAEHTDGRTVGLFTPRRYR